MKKLKIIILGIGAITMLWSCNQFKESAHGFAYRFIKQSGDSSLMPNKGEFYVFNMTFTIPNKKDTVIYSNHDKQMPIIVQYTPRENQLEGIVLKIVEMCGKGDSIQAQLQVQAVDFFEKERVPMHNFPGVDSTDYMLISIGVEEVLKSEEEIDTYLSGKEIEKIEKYLSNNGLDVNKTESGLRYIVEEMGEGDMPIEGDKIQIHYVGEFLNGEEFDNSVKRGKPFEFVLGKGQVIRGWDEGLTFFNKGSKGKLIVPSTLGYGASGYPLPPYSTLVFNIELIDIIKENK